MADFTALGRAHPAGLADGEGREVVVEHKGFLTLPLQSVNDLRVALGAQGSHHQGLGLAAGKQGGAMGARQHAGAHADLAHVAGGAAVDAALAGQNAATDGGLLQLADRGQHVAFAERRFGTFFGGAEFFHRFGAHSGHTLLALELVGNAIGLANAVAHGGLHGLGQGGVLFRRLPIPIGLAAFGLQFIDGVDHHLHLFVAEHHSAQHHVFGQGVSLGLHHQHGPLGAGHGQVQPGFGDLGIAGVEDIFAIDITDPRGADGAGGQTERHAGEGEGGGGADQRGQFRIHIRIQRQDGTDDLHLLAETLGKQGTQGTVNKTGGEGFLFGRTAFAPEKTAGDLAGGVGLFLIIDGQREEIAGGPRIFIADGGDQHHGLGHMNDHRAGGLAGNFAGF